MSHKNWHFRFRFENVHLSGWDGRRFEGLFVIFVAGYPGITIIVVTTAEYGSYFEAPGGKLSLTITILLILQIRLLRTFYV